MSKGIESKAFLGYQKGGEIKVQLHQSPQWNRDNGINANTLTETSWNKKDYIGLCISLPISSVELKKLENEIKSQMHHYCPKLDLEKQVLYLFSQVFVS